MATNPQVVENATTQTMRGKYDRTGKWNRKLKHNQDGSLREKPGPKPLWLKNLSRNGSCKVLKGFDSIATAEDIYREAWQARQFSLCVQMRESAADRAFGKPYTALNPAEDKKPGVQDNRLQVAIQNLIMPACEAQSKRKKRKALALNEASSEAAVTLEASTDASET